LVARHQFIDASGILLFEKRRYQKPNRNTPKGYEKTLRFCHPINDGWFWGTGTEERPLYRLQNLLVAPSEPVYVCESEKVCDKLAKLNLLATCVASGWSNADVEPLRGRDCFVLVDNNADGTGEKKAADATEAVCKIARSIRIARKGGPADSENLADMIGVADFSVEDFVRACRDAPLYQPESSPSPEKTLVWECMSDVEPEPVDWIWSGRIARGKLTLLAGDPGIGKSQVATDVASHITEGNKFPDGISAPLGSVLILTAEDSAKDTVRPRLEAAGADLARVHRLKAAVFKDGVVTTFSLQHDLAALTDKLKMVGDVMLVIIDPITSYMGSKIDSHRVTDVRAVLEPLAGWAEENHVAVLGITHPPKNAPPRALHAIVGSIAYVAAARLVFLAVEEQGTNRRLLLAVKNNLGALAPGIGYSLEQAIISKDIVASRIAWDNLPVTVSANEALAAANGGDTGAMTEAKDFLREELADGPRPAQDIKKAAQAAGLSWGTVRRAQERLGIKPRKTGLDGVWQWQLPEDAHSRPEDAQP
jgi:putative DNA primase/helicase